ncbi:hypothetical protein QTQ03_28350 [Micromonospora sp. WMMA1363]|uniref:hypothetical protein n=1 Tax=Micromonospora sp. WMMA1363 TaxID=3053985 RepID=UPI00259D2873|nr:hypothetical protein [Micromonospora sp. WMMA1363]MDM4723319.1 hypothetical protein [Micromonospora sp. WMMA1363]
MTARARALLVVVGLVFAVMPASPARADDAEDRAAAEVAAERCAQMLGMDEVPRQYQEECERKLTEDLLSGRAGSPQWADSVCGWVPDLPVVGNPCKALASLMAGVYEQYQARVADLRGVAEAITDPVNSALLHLAQAFADSLESLLSMVFGELVHLSSPNIASESFLTTYAAGAGIGMFVLVVMIMRVLYRASAGDVTGEELAESLWRWAPTAVLLVIFGPAVGHLLVGLSDAASDSILDYFASDIASLAAKLGVMLHLSQVGAFPGGPLVALFVLVIAFFGVIGLIGGLLVQVLALYLTGAVMAVAFVMLVDPGTRKRALRLPMTWMALVFARALLFFLVGAVSRLADSALTVDAIHDDGLRALVTALTAALALLIVGLAPWTLLKYAPVLPAGASEQVGRASRSSSGGALGSVAQSTMLHLSHRRYQDPSSGGMGSPPGARPGPAASASPPLSTGGPETSSGAAARASSPAQASRAAASGERGQTPQTGSTSTTDTPAAAAGMPRAAADGGRAGTGAGATTAGAGAGATTAGTGGTAAAAALIVQAGDAAKRAAQDKAERASDVVKGE